MSNKCAAGVELPKRGPCPECGNGPSEGCARAQVRDQTELESLRAQLASARKALEEIEKERELCPVYAEYVPTNGANIAAAALNEINPPPAEGH